MATAAGLMHVTSAKLTAESPAGPVVAKTAIAASVPFRLVLSAPAAEVKIDTGGPVVPVSLDSSPMIGKLELDPSNPHVSLFVHWKNPPAAGEHRFAKLALEAAGQPTLTHIFDADGDIDELLELPLPSAK
ncbi:MAG: hypothetical protein ABI073_11840 [Luteolibacter sp.]